MENSSNTVKKKKAKRLDAKENFWGYVFLSPVIIGFLVFTVFPVIMSFYYSLTNYDLVKHCSTQFILLLEQFLSEYF